ncbi:MAG: response regulator [Chlorobiaceae bacterium]|nr:response regulator [Chlorobiaceae bacterium]
MKNVLPIKKIGSLTREILDHAEPNLSMIGAFTTFGYPVYYIIWTFLFPQPYENLPLRLFCMVITIPCMLYNKIPSKLKKYFPAYFYLTFFIDVPFFFNFMMLENECSIIWVTSLLAGIFMMVLILSNWLVISTMLITGFFLAYFSVILLDGAVSFSKFIPEWIPIILFAIVGSIFANHNRQLANKTKISFLRSLSGSIAHEMRNPLNSITAALASVQSSLPVKPDRNNRGSSYNISHTGLLNIHEVIEESTGTLTKANKIIDSILTSMQGKEVSMKDFMRIDAGKAIEKAVNSFPYNDSLDRKLITIDTSRDFDFLGDHDLFYYVLFNLLKNSLYYRDKEGFGITVKTEQDVSGNRVIFRDTGPGIPAADRERVFESFYTSNKKGGNGLGLSFCRRVIDSFGGTITCNSKEGEWSEFILTFEQYTSKKTGELKKQILADKHILIVDDHLSNRLLMAKYLSDMNVAFDLAENGKHALALLSESRYDLVFMDFEMPVLTGDEAVKILRSSQDMCPDLAFHYLQTPVIGITALPKTEALARAEKSGINEVLFKPVKKSQVHEIIEKYFFNEQKPLCNDHEELLKGKSILLVDDNETSRKFVTLLLKNYGCRIEQAVNGKAALEAVEKNSFDLILMDIEMPVMNGIEASKAIRAGLFSADTTDDRKKSVPIIALTGNTDEKSKEKINAAGIDFVIGKPVFRDELVSVIAVILKSGISDKNRQLPGPPAEENMDSETFFGFLETEPLVDTSIISNLEKIGGEELLANLFETYISDTERMIIELEAFLAAKDMKGVTFILHTLKGSSASVGANKMFLLSRYINEYCPEQEAGSCTDCEALLKRIKNIFAETRQYLQNSIRLFV